MSRRREDAVRSVEPGLRNMASRSVQAAERFLEFAQGRGLTRAEAERALAEYRRLRVIRLDAVGGTFHVKHGGFLDADVLRRAAAVGAGARRDPRAVRRIDARDLRVGDVITELHDLSGQPAPDRRPIVRVEHGRWTRVWYSAREHDYDDYDRNDHVTVRRAASRDARRHR